MSVRLFVCLSPLCFSSLSSVSVVSLLLLLLLLPSALYTPPPVPHTHTFQPISPSVLHQSDAVTFGEGQDNSGETLSPWSALQTVTTIYFLLPYIRPDPRLCDITRGLDPYAL